MSPSPLKTPGSGSGAGAGSEQASCVGSDRHQSSTTAAPTESSNVDIGSGKLITFFVCLLYSLLFCSRPTPSAILGQHTNSKPNPICLPKPSLTPSFHSFRSLVRPCKGHGCTHTSDHR
ncbi:hypothetical protein HZ326_25707 [Fusarium oxysporum f. sp. albedinis]|nr:hypothetical protein HZ326_25707 [Fusarium oxysporum f. sp. albedinis]